MPKEDGYKNLIVPSSVEARKNGKKGGQSRAKKAENKKRFQSAVLAALEAKTDDGQDILATLIAAQIKKAQEGDTRAFEVLRDTSGEKPTDKVEASVTNDNKELMRDYLNAIKNGK